jgi:hypothetical protein
MVSGNVNEAQKRELGLAYRFLSEAYYYDSDFNNSIEAGKTALSVIRPLLRADPRSLSYARAYVAALMITAESSSDGPKDYVGALTFLNEGSTIYRSFVRRDPDDTGTFANLLSLEGDRASVLAAAGEHAQARALSDEITQQNEVFAKKYPSDLMANRNRARALASRAELLSKIAGREAGCEGKKVALDAWKTFGAKFGLTDSDKHDIVDGLEIALIACSRI